MHNIQHVKCEAFIMHLLMWYTIEYLYVSSLVLGQLVLLPTAVCKDSITTQTINSTLENTIRAYGYWIFQGLTLMGRLNSFI